MRMKRSRYMVVLVFVAFFIMSLLTNVLGPIVPDIIDSFKVSLAAAAFLAFCFFIAYGVTSIPAGFLVERLGEKIVMLGSFVTALLGSLGFALHPSYATAMVCFFLIGAGMTTLQVVLNPLLRVSGGEEHFAFNSAFAQLIFGAASFLSPRLYSYLVTSLSGPAHQPNLLLTTLAKLTPSKLPWVSIYWIFAACTVIMIAVVWLSPFPQVHRTSEEQAGTFAMYRSLFRKPAVWVYFASVFAYVGSEQGTADWISKFLGQYHGFDPHTTGAAAVSWFWGLLTVGCLIGMLLLKIFDSRRLLVGASVGALLCLTAALFGPVRVSLMAFPAIGLFASVMWPILVSLALNSVLEYQGSFSGILSTGIMGGAIVPLIIGRLGDAFGLRSGLCVLYLTFVCVLVIGFWAEPIIPNATLTLKRAVVQPNMAGL
jgi:FHS family L-fucose permease-like MFS transporter